MPLDAWSKCARIVSENICKVGASVICALTPIISVAYFKIDSVGERLVAVELQGTGNSEALSFLSGEVAKQNKEIITALQEIELNTARLATQLEERTGKQ